MGVAGEVGPRTEDLGRFLESAALSPREGEGAASEGNGGKGGPFNNHRHEGDNDPVHVAAGVVAEIRALWCPGNIALPSEAPLDKLDLVAEPRAQERCCR